MEYTSYKKKMEHSESNENETLLVSFYNKQGYWRGVFTPLPKVKQRNMNTHVGALAGKATHGAVSESETGWRGYTVISIAVSHRLV